MRRRKTTREKRVAHLEERLAVLRSEIEGLETEAADLDSKLAALREDEAKAYIGDADPEEVAHRRNEIESRLAEVVRVIDRKRGLVEPLQRELAKAEKALADSRIATAKNAWLEDLYAQHVAAAALQKSLREAAKAGEALEGARRKAAESGEFYEASCRDAGEEADEPPDIADEPAWNEGLERLRALLEGGPLRPVAKHKAALATSRAQWQHQRGERIAWALRQGPSTFHHLRPDEREEAERRWTAQRAADTPEERTRRAIERARATGQGLIVNGEVLVEPKRD